MLWCSGRRSLLFTASVVGMMGCHSPIQSCAFSIGQALLQRYDNFFYYNTVIYYSFLQIGHFTLDNAANNKTMMHGLSLKLLHRDIDFDADDRRIMCFGHIIDLATKQVVQKVD